MLSKSSVPAVRAEDDSADAAEEARLRKFRDPFDNDVLTPMEGVDFAARPTDPEMVRRLAALQLSDDELCEVLRIDKSTLDDVYGSAIANGRAQGRVALRRKQWQKAMQGNVPMLIHLGNQHLAQKEPDKNINHTVNGKITLEDETDPREKLFQMMQQAASRLANMPVAVLPAPKIENDDEF